MTLCYLLRYVMRGVTAFHGEITNKLGVSLRQHRAGTQPWEGDALIDARLVTMYPTWDEAREWKKRVSALDHQSKTQIWAISKPIIEEGILSGR